MNGRRAIQAEPEEVEADVVYQVGALAAFVGSHGARLVHVKPHGALYNQAAQDATLARAIACGVVRIYGGLRLVGLASSEPMRRAAEEEGLVFAAEAFADRGYASDGSLLSRNLDGSVILDPQRAAAQAVQIVTQGRVATAEGRDLPLRADTLCLHGDNPNAEEIAWAVRQALGAAGVEVRALDR